jgi:hypothetical protein
MFQFYSELSFVGKIIFWLGVLIIFCSICSQCIVCEYIPIKMVFGNSNKNTQNINISQSKSNVNKFMNERNNSIKRRNNLNDKNSLDEFFEDIRQIDYDINHSTNY